MFLLLSLAIFTLKLCACAKDYSAALKETSCTRMCQSTSVCIAKLDEDGNAICPEVEPNKEKCVIVCKDKKTRPKLLNPLSASARDEQAFQKQADSYKDQFNTEMGEDGHSMDMSPLFTEYDSNDMTMIMPPIVDDDHSFDQNTDVYDISRSISAMEDQQAWATPISLNGEELKDFLEVIHDHDKARHKRFLGKRIKYKRMQKRSILNYANVRLSGTLQLSVADKPIGPNILVDIKPFAAGQLMKLDWSDDSKGVKEESKNHSN